MLPYLAQGFIAINIVGKIQIHFMYSKGVEKMKEFHISIYIDCDDIKMECTEDCLNYVDTEVD